MRKIPTLKELYDSIVADLENEMNVSIPLYGKVALRAIAAAQAAKLKLVYLQVGRVQKNIFVDTADPESMGGTLERFGRIKLGRNPFPARAGEYTATVTGIGGDISASQTFKSNDDSFSPGKLFIIDAPYELEDSPGEITIRALESGLDSRLMIGDRLTATSPIAGVDRIITISGEVTAPLEAESLEDYRQKAIESFQTEPQGGAATDYRIWAADVQGVKKVYPYARSGAGGEINLFVEATTGSSIDGHGTPSPAMLEEVRAVIEFDPDDTKPLNERGRRPLTVVEVHCLPVTVLNVLITIEGFQGLTPSIEESIKTAVNANVSNVRPFVGASDVLADKNDILDKNRIISTILQAAPGSVFGNVTMEVDGVEYSSYEFLYGDIPVLDDIDYV